MGRMADAISSCAPSKALTKPISIVKALAISNLSALTILLTSTDWRSVAAIREVWLIATLILSAGNY